MKKIFFVFLMLSQCLLAQRVGKPLGEYYGTYTNQLKIGNAWVYRDYWWRLDHKIEIIDTAWIEGEKFFQLKSTSWDGYSNMTNLLRLRQDGYYFVIDTVYGTPTGEFYIYYKKDTFVGNFWVQNRVISQDLKIYHKVIDSGSIASFWGTWIDVKKIEITDSILTDYFEYWSEEFGLVRIELDNPDAGGVLFLWGCAINGTVYGDTSFVVSVDDPIPNNPSDFELYQNYPNPFNPSTIIQYKIHKTSLVKLKVYDILGKEVAVLVNEVKSEGSYSVSFDASDLPSGIYIYSLRVNDFIQNNKMTLLK